jgi:hypothetical protein
MCAFARRMKLDSSLLKAEHVHVLSPRAGLRRNDAMGLRQSLKFKLIMYVRPFL